MKAKFKVGDRVKMLDGSKIKGFTGGWWHMMSKHIGECATIQLIKEYGNGKTGCRVDKFGYVWDTRALELIEPKRVKPETIVIYRKDNEVIALDKTTGEKGVARCSPKDEFDFMFGAKLAFERLTTPKEEKPVYFTGKVVCIESLTGAVTKGKIYEFKDGYSFYDNGARMPATSGPILNVDDLNKRLSSVYLKIVE